MTTVTQVHHIDRAELDQKFDELKRMLESTTANGQAIPVGELPPFSAAQAAEYLGCSQAHLGTIVQRHPEILKPIVKPGKATRYDVKQLFEIKSKNLVK